MPRGKSKRGRKPGIFASSTADSTTNQYGDSETKGIPQTANVESSSDPMEDIDDQARRPEESSKVEEEKTTPASAAEDETEEEVRPPCRRLTEGEIDVDDAESESSDTEDEALAPGETRSSALPAERAAEDCRLSAKQITTEEFALFPFLQTASRPLREAFLVARNSACLLWVEDPTTQVTSDRLVGFLVTSLNTDGMRVMYEAGLTAPLLTKSASTVSVGTAAPTNGTRSFTPPANWSPWSTQTSRLNLERLAYLAVLFLERFGYINYGIFKLLSPPLTRFTPGNKFGVGITGAADSSLSPLRRTGTPASARRSLTMSPEKQTTCATASSAGPPFRVIVCGAGAAGLMAARQLTYFGAKVTILESRDRLGGRIWTLRRGENVADLGAMIITGMSANPLTILAKQASLALIPVNTGCSLYAPSGRPVSREKDEKMEEEFNRLLATATHLCHSRGLDTNLTDGTSLSLGGVLEDLIRYQENHIVPLKTTHRKLVSILLERKAKTLGQMASARDVIEKAFQKWQQATQLAKQASEPTSVGQQPQQQKPEAPQQQQPPDAGSPMPGARRRKQQQQADETSPASSASTSPSKARSAALATAGSTTGPNTEGLSPSQASGRRGEKRAAVAAKEGKADEGALPSPAKQPALGRRSGPQKRKKNDSENVSPITSPPRSTEAKNSLQETMTKIPRVFDLDMEYEKRRLLSELHQAWKEFDPLQSNLARINQQLEVLAQNPPRDVYLTPSERHLIDWHFANLEFANATELKNLSLRHWDQDDAFELTGAHCAIRGCFGGIVDALVTTASSVSTSSPSTPSSSITNGERPALKVDTTTLVPSGSSACGQIELKSCVKSITIAENGVTVDSLNAAFSPDEPISYKAAAVICTFPLGVLKESARRQREAATKTPAKQQQSSSLCANAPLFDPLLPEWKLAAIERLGFGCLNKVVLFFDRFFWDKSQRSFGCVNDCTEKRGELFLFWSVTERPCLVALVAGRSALDLEQAAPGSSGEAGSASANGKTSRGGSTLSTPVTATATAGGPSSHLKEPIVAVAMAKLRKIFKRDVTGDSDSGKGVPDPIDAYVTRWQSDVNSRGSYSYVAVGATGEDYDLLAEPLSLADTGETAGQETPEPRNLFFHPTPTSTAAAAVTTIPGTSAANCPRIFFAGEHTCRHYPASVHGALLSGLREAARIANAFFPGETPVTNSGFILNPPASAVVSTGADETSA
nr:unnamed protein product [Spirometra erinaceieuropaei]